MRKILCVAGLLLTLNIAKAQPGAWSFSGKLVEKNIITHKDTAVRRFVHDPLLYNECWDTLPQTVFWRKIIDLSQDYCLVNVAGTRQVLGVVEAKAWNSKSEIEKASFKDSLRIANKLDASSSIYITAGKREFYSYKKVVPSISEAIRVFKKEGTDPWYAQVILLIESPGKVQKSSVGAYGPFQLMKGVAKKYGLVINKYVDERENFDRAGMAAARLIGRVCVPEVKRMLDRKAISYNETDLWFRLLVLHAYHAGSGNLAGAINFLDPCEGGMKLITNLWRTEHGGFRNASQNYSQIALASLMRFDEVVYHQKDTVFLVEGDKWFYGYRNMTYAPGDNTLKFLNECFAKYESDLLDETVDIGYFLSKIKVVEREMVTVCTKDGCKQEMVERTLQSYGYNASDTQLDQLGQKLMRQRRTEEAIEIFKYNVSLYPKSSIAYSSLAEAYRRSGKKEMAVEQYKKALSLNPMDPILTEQLNKVKGG
jgi:tetratricopeptide (TPR) repeat protein